MQGHLVVPIMKEQGPMVMRAVGPLLTSPKADGSIGFMGESSGLIEDMIKG